MYKLLVTFFILFNTFNVIRAQDANKKDIVELNIVKENIKKKRDSLTVLYKNYYLQIDTSLDTTLKAELKLKVDKLEIYTEQLNYKEIDSEFNFIRKNLSANISIDFLLFRLKRREGLKLYDTIVSIYKRLPMSIKGTTEAKSLSQAIFDYKNSNINSKAPDFSINDLNNNQIKLSNFKKEKYILIDFWATWCKPCREEFGYLKEIYSKYKNNGFDIISFSRDEDIESWKKVIEKEKISDWIHISTTLNKSNIESKYFVNAIPMKILINKDGLIVGRWRGGGEQNKEELLNLLQEIFHK